MVCAEIAQLADGRQENRAGNLFFSPAGSQPAATAFSRVWQMSVLQIGEHLLGVS